MSNFCQVAVAPLAQLLTYKVPDHLSSEIAIGTRVEVPLGNRKAIGFVLELADAPEQAAPDTKAYTIKELYTAFPAACVFSDEQLSFFSWVARFYQEPIANVLETALPEPVEPRTVKVVKLCLEPEQPLKGQTQRAIINDLRAKPEIFYSALLRKYPGSSSSIRSLEKKGLIIIHERKETKLPPEPPTTESWAKSHVSLRQEQIEALNSIEAAIDSNTYSPFLLHGITGSGKTEVYIDAIKHVLKNGRGALVIVPEIALTPQLVERFRVRLGSDLSILHSGLSKHDRWAAWQALLKGQSRIVVGARSAVFAPVKDIGLIIVDEEHDASFKQADAFRYNARDLAMARAQLCKAAVVLGSATPSLETYWKAKAKRIGYLTLSSRHAKSVQPQIEIVDLNRFTPSSMISRNISPPLYQALQEVFKRGEQVFLLYNRRGFATYLQCAKCEQVLECTNCSVTLTFHQKRQRLLCHYCGASLIPPRLCQSCDNRDESLPAELVQRGAGTERVFEEVRELFPDVAIERLDRDIVNKSQQLEEILSRVRSGETQALVGTQMIAKGHDLPGVTLVGIVDCDIGLHMPDFRAGERAFQLLTQASGRAGRGDLPGRVLLQTRVPNHPSLIHTQSHNFEGYALHELQERKALGYPPYSRLLRVIVSGPNSKQCQEILWEIKSSLERYTTAKNIGIISLGPTPAPIERIKTRWRWHLIIKCQKINQLQRILSYLKQASKVPSNVRVAFDLDPLDML